MIQRLIPTTRQRGMLQVTVPAEQEYVRVVRMVVGGAAASVGLHEEDIADLKVAVSEACTNAVLHAYDPVMLHPDRTVEVNLSLWDGAVEVDVRDQGAGVASDTATLNPKNEPDEGGFGLTLIGCLMDAVELVDDETAGTRLRFLKRRADA